MSAASATSSKVLSNALDSKSFLQTSVQAGLQAMGTYSSRIEEVSLKATDSLDLDAATKQAHPNSHRWDYVLGLAQTSISSQVRGTSPPADAVVAVEVHSATDGEVSVVISKKSNSKTVLDAELRAGKSVTRWVWIASGKTKWSANSSALRRLASARIEFAGKSLRL